MFLCKMFLLTGFIKACPCQVVDIKIEICIANHPIRKLFRSTNILFVQSLDTVKVPCFPHAH